MWSGLTASHPSDRSHGHLLARALASREECALDPYQVSQYPGHRYRSPTCPFRLQYGRKYCSVCVHQHDNYIALADFPSHAGHVVSALPTCMQVSNCCFFLPTGAHSNYAAGCLSQFMWFGSARCRSRPAVHGAGTLRRLRGVRVRWWWTDFSGCMPHA